MFPSFCFVTNNANQVFTYGREKEREVDCEIENESSYTKLCKRKKRKKSNQRKKRKNHLIKVRLKRK